jgi:hypothetical protein
MQQQQVHIHTRTYNIDSAEKQRVWFNFLLDIPWESLMKSGWETLMGKGNYSRSAKHFSQRSVRVYKSPTQMTLDFSFVNEWVRSLFPDTVINFSPLMCRTKMLHKASPYKAQQIQCQTTRDIKIQFATYVKAFYYISEFYDFVKNLALARISPSAHLSVYLGKHISLPHLLIKGTLWVMESPRARRSLLALLEDMQNIS